MHRMIGLILLLSLPAFAVDKVMVLGLFSGKAVLQIDGKRRVLKVGERSPEGLLLVAADSNGATVEIDGTRQRMELGSHIGSSFQGPQLAEVQVWPDKRGMYKVIGSINGLPVDFLVDTGATTIAMNSAQAKRLGIDFRVQGDRGMVSTASDVVPAYKVTLDRVTVGDITLRQVISVVIDGAQPQDVLLGMSFLGQLDMQRQGQVMVLKQKW